MATSNKVNISDVGVMIAAITSMTTIACRRKRLIKAEERIPSLPRSQHKTGNSNRIPISKVIIVSVSIYDCNVIILSTSLLT